MLAEFSDWLMRTYSVKMLNIEFSQLLGSKTNKYRLMLVIESQKDYQKIHALLLGPAEEAKRPITDEFRRLALKYQLTADEQLRDIFVTCVDFSNEAMTDANWNAANEVKRRIKRKYPVVWDIRPMFSGSVVFYYSDFDVTINENKGISAAITNDYYSILKKYDELNYFTRENSMLKFDSKENFDKTYKGNFYYYMH